MLRALHRFLGTGVPVVGVNFGRIGFLTSIAADGLEDGVGRVLAGEYKVFELATLALTVAGRTHTAINDVVATSARPGRMIELGSAVGGESIGDQACDGMICCTPSGSTAYNLSSGGPVITWGLDAMAITYVAPHSLHARPARRLARARPVRLEPDSRRARHRRRRRTERRRAPARRLVLRRRRPREGAAGAPARSHVLHPPA